MTYFILKQVSIYMNIWVAFFFPFYLHLSIASVRRQYILAVIEWQIAFLPILDYYLQQNLWTQQLDFQNESFPKCNFLTFAARPDRFTLGTKLQFSH